MAPVYIIAHFDVKKPNSTFTRDKPTIQNLCRIVLQAKHSFNLLKTCINNFESSENFKVITQFRTSKLLLFLVLKLYKAVFKPNVSHFDICIKLKPQYCAKAYQSVEMSEGIFLPHYHHQAVEGEPPTKSTLLPVVDFDPVRIYVDELRDSYGEIALFFYDLYGCTNIYALFKPDALKPKELKLANSKYCVINENTKKLELNLSAFVDDLRLIGTDLVDNIVISNQKIFQ